MPFNWLRDTTTSYRMGFVEGLDGQDYLLSHAARDASEYQRGYADGEAKRQLDNWHPSPDGIFEVNSGGQG